MKIYYTQTTIFCVLILVVLGCGPKLIPGLSIKVEDTPEHRALIQVMHEFCNAFEQMDIERLVKFASSDFYENAGTPETDDDYDYKGLHTHFIEYFKHIKKTRLQIKFKTIQIDKNATKAHIDYHYVCRFLMDLPSGEKWHITDDVNRIELVKEQDKWKILTGM